MPGWITKSFSTSPIVFSTLRIPCNNGRGWAVEVRTRSYACLSGLRTRSLNPYLVMPIGIYHFFKTGLIQYGYNAIALVLDAATNLFALR